MSKQQLTMSWEEVMGMIDMVTGPSVMSKKQARDFLIDLREQIMGRIEALNDEIRMDERDEAL